MRRSRGALSLLLITCLLAAAFTNLPTPAAAASEASEEDAAEAAALKAEAAGEADPDAPEVADEEEEEGPVDEKDVLVLTDATFNETLKQHKFLLAEFYAPWCGHCKALKPEWAKAATALKHEGSDVVLAKVDATVETKLGRQYATEGYPTLKWFVDGEPLEFTARGRNAPDIIGWVKKRTGPPAKTLTTTAEFDTAKADSKPFVVGYFSKFEGDGYKAFADAALAIDETAVYQTSDAAVAKAAGLTAEGTVSVARTFEGLYETSVFDGKLERDAIKDWIKAERVPPYVEFNDENQETIFGSGIHLNIIIAANADQLKPNTPLTNAIRAAHAKTKGKAIYVTCTRGTESAEPVLEFFNLQRTSNEPQVLAFHILSSLKYFLRDTAITNDSLTKFASDVIDGKVKPEFKSQEIPTGDAAKDGDITVVVGKNFDDIVLDNTKDVFLEVYAPWCGHCKALTPTYQRLAKRFKDVDSVVIAKIDGTENEHEKLQVDGFPSMLLFKANNPEGEPPLMFMAPDRSLKSLTDFIKKNAGSSFSLPKAVADAEDAENKADEEATKQAAEAPSQEEEDEEMPADGEPIDLEDLEEGDFEEDGGDDSAEDDAAADAAAHEEL